MKLVKIKNKFMFKQKDGQGPDPNGTHIYIYDEDKKTGEKRLIPTTHVLDPKRQREIDNKAIMMMKLPKVRHISGIRKNCRTHDVNGNLIDLKTLQAQNINGGKAVYLPTKTADKIRKFVNKKNP